MSKAKTAVSAAVAAMAVGVGVYVGVLENEASQEPQPIRWEDYLPDIDKYIPDIEKYVPDMSSYGISTGSLLPELPSVSVDTPVPSTDAPDVQVPELSVPEMQQIDVTIPKTSTVDLDYLKKIHNRYERLSASLKDRRRFDYDNTALCSEYTEQWLAIYKEYTGKKFPKHQLGNSSFRMISEVRVPKNTKQFDILKENLEYYRGRGYDTVLVVFDGSEVPSDLTNMVKYLRYMKWRVWFAFGGDESLRTTIFVDPVRLREQLMAVAEFSDGMCLGWRSTSAHLLDQDEPYTNYLVYWARQSNSRLKILGEVYYGNTHKYPEAGKYGWGINMPDYASGALLCNFGYVSVDIQSVINRLVPSKIGKCPKVALVVGYAPYYLTVNRNGFPQEENQKIKERVENLFRSYGCVGTITLHDDGRNGIGGYAVNNSLSDTHYSDLK